MHVSRYGRSMFYGLYRDRTTRIEYHASMFWARKEAYSTECCKTEYGETCLSHVCSALGDKHMWPSLPRRILWIKSPFFILRTTNTLHLHRFHAWWSAYFEARLFRNILRTSQLENYHVSEARYIVQSLTNNVLFVRTEHERENICSHLQFVYRLLHNN